MKETEHAAADESSIAHVSGLRAANVRFHSLLDPPSSEGKDLWLVTEAHVWGCSMF
jgi:hypothetical protein